MLLRKNRIKEKKGKNVNKKKKLRESLLVRFYIINIINQTNKQSNKSKSDFRSASFLKHVITMLIDFLASIDVPK